MSIVIGIPGPPYLSAVFWAESAASARKSVHLRAPLPLYGLQLASQNVHRRSWAIPIDTVEDLTHTCNGDELAQLD